jgi:hypothetical protein
MNNNGRVDFDETKNNKKLYELHHDPIRKNIRFNDEATVGIHERSITNKIYFSQDNIDALQEGIRYRVYVESNKKYIIDKQSEDELKIIMRSIYLQFAYFDSKNVLNEMKFLNKKVIDFCVPRILREIKQYLYYIEDIKNLPKPLEYGQFSSNKGNKIVELKNFI